MSEIPYCSRVGCAITQKHAHDSDGITIGQGAWHIPGTMATETPKGCTCASEHAEDGCPYMIDRCDWCLSLESTVARQAEEIVLLTRLVKQQAAEITEDHAVSVQQEEEIRQLMHTNGEIAVEFARQYDEQAAQLKLAVEALEQLRPMLGGDAWDFAFDALRTIKGEK